MSDDYDDLYDITNLDDGELKELVLQQLREYPDIDVDLVEVEVERGNVRLAGRVGTEQEVQTVEHVVTDLIGGERVRNELVIFDAVRGERSEAADDAFVEDMEADPQISVGQSNTSDEAQHYEPPDRAIQQGTYSIEDH
jgi:hypothetical protein